MINKAKLLMGRKIPLDGKNSIYVHQPKVHEVVDMEEDNFNRLILPFVLTEDSIFGGLEGEEELKSKFTIFDLFFVEAEEGKTPLDSIFDGVNSLESLTLSLSFFLRSDSIRVLKNRKKIVINNSYLLDNQEFIKLRSIIQSISSRKDIEIEKPPKNMTERQKDIWNKLQKGRRRVAEKNAIFIQDVINYVAFGGKSFIPYEEIDNMTYYQLQRIYKNIVGYDAYNIGMSYKLSQKYEYKDEVKHWIETLKIGN